MQEQRVLIEVTGSPNTCVAAVALASVWGKGSMLAFVQQLGFFGEWAADRIDEDYDIPDLSDLQGALAGVETLKRQLTLEVRRLLGDAPSPAREPATPTATEASNAQ